MNSLSIYLPYIMSKKDVEKTILQRRTRIMVFGTFDGLHEGHINFFKQAKSFIQNSSLIVSIARDKNVLRIKGEYPEKNEMERMILVEKCQLVDRVVLSGIKNHLPHIVRIHPDIIALGYDQKAYIDKRGSRGRASSYTASESKSHQGNPYVKNLKKDLKNKGISVKIVRLKPYKKNIYKNHLLLHAKGGSASGGKNKK